MENKLNQEQSVEFIKEMILQAKGNIAKESGSYFILWGYLIIIASIIDFITKFNNLDINIGYVWLISMLIAGVGHFILAKKEKNTKNATSHIDHISTNIWTGFIVSTIIINIVLQISGKGDLITPSILFIYTFTLYCTAVVCKFKQLYISVAVCVLCIISYLFISPIYYTLPMAVAMLAGNIVPGHLLRHNSKKDV